MIDHVSIPVRDLARSADLYAEVLAPLGLTRLAVRERTVGFGKAYPEFWLNLRAAHEPTDDSGMHVCLRARDEIAVKAFHAAALAAGCACDGPPGPRDGAITRYFAAFIRDVDGNKIEAATFPRSNAQPGTI